MGSSTFFEKHLLSTLCLSSLLVFMAAGQRPARQDSADLSNVGFNAFVQNVNDIESKLGKSLSSKNENSVVCVPSLQILLGLVYGGAGGKTASEFQRLFGVDDKKLQTLDSFKKLISSLQLPEVKIANTAYVAKGLTLKKEFVELGQKYFDINVNQADFTQKEQLADNVNKWVAQKTENLIKDLIQADSISDDAKLILLNAIYFKGKWETKFNEQDTKDGKFKVSKTEETDVKYMEQTGNFQYAQDEDYQYLIMPYTGGKLSMLIVLPKTHEVFEKKDISKKSLNALQFREEEVHILMPKFKVESKIDWVPLLEDTIPSAFRTTANLTGISDTPLMVSQITQKAFIEVDEEGTKAAAATGAALGSYSFKVEPKRFSVERPFYYYIQAHARSEKSFLFQGAVKIPKL